MSVRRAVLILLGLGLLGCTNVRQEIFDPVSANNIDPAVRIIRHDVVVPQELTVSEANYYYPVVDIVWRDDPPGDRHAQVKAVVDDALDWGLAAFNRGRPVVVTLEVRRFHALTQKARYTVGGVHSMKFTLLVWDAQTGSAIYGPVPIDGDLIALGGNKAIAADANGLTQKVRITQHLAGTIQRHLIQAGLGTYRGQNDG